MTKVLPPQQYSNQLRDEYHNHPTIALRADANAYRSAGHEDDSEQDPGTSALHVPHLPLSG
jgi:hypothetical protein